MTISVKNISAIGFPKNNIGKHKIPRYLYHLTNEENYNSILADGKLKVSDKEFLSGVFMFELPNFFKRWGFDESWGYNFKEKLMYRCLKHKDKLVILKIPTDKLDKTKLNVRVHDDLFRELNQAKSWIMKHVGEVNCFDDLKKIYQKYHPEAMHIFKGEPATEASRIKQRKKSIEYIYPESISSNNVEKIGEVNVIKFMFSDKYDLNYPMRSIFAELLKGTPEQNCTKLLKD